MGGGMKSTKSSLKEVKASPHVLRELREMSGYSEEEVARKLKTSPEKVRAVEKGEKYFTLNQIKKLADIYKRPLAAFFSDSIRRLPDIVDFRSKKECRLTPDVYLAKRRAVYLADKMMEFVGEKSSIPEIPPNLSPERLAMWLREELRIESPPSGKGISPSPARILDYYKRSFEESMGILIIEYPMKSEDVRAFCINSDISVIVLKESEAPQGKLFSLAHEVCHLLKGTSSICSIDLEREGGKEERFCNKFAAEFLVPASELRELLRNLRGNYTSRELIKMLTKKYGVSRQAMAIRLMNLGFIERAEYEELMKEIEESRKAAKGGGGRDWSKVFYNRAGGLAVSEMKKALREEKVSLYDAADILDLKMKYAELLLSE